MKTIKYLMLLMVTALTFSACVVRENNHRAYVRGHYEIGAYGHRYWVPGHYR